MPLPKHNFYLRLVFCMWFICGFSGRTASAQQEGYWVPADPPKSHYMIDVRIDPSNGLIEGKETIEFKNISPGYIGAVAFD